MIAFRHAGILKIAALTVAIGLGAVLQGQAPTAKAHDIATETAIPRIMPANMTNDGTAQPQPRFLVVPNVMVRHPVPMPFFLPPVQHRRIILVPQHRLAPQQHAPQMERPVPHPPGVAI